jgi:hypothetical protein
MSGQSGSRSDPHSSALRAVFVPEGTEDRLDAAGVVDGVGAGPLRLAGVLVPGEGVPPGYPFVQFGEFHPDDEQAGAGESSHRDHRSAGESAVGSRQNDDHSSGRRPVLRRERRSQPAPGLAAADADASGGAPPTPRTTDVSADAIQAALRALATPPAYDDLSELIDRAVADNPTAAPSLPR